MSISSYQWAPLVYGRTLEVDFRLLSIPQGLDQTDLDWVKSHISSSIIYPDDLRDGHRWSIFKNERYCVFALTCMANLVSTRRVVVQNRDLYVFAGYVSKIDSELFPEPPHHPPVPTLAAVNRPPFGVFRTLYEYVDFLWEDERTILERKDIEQSFGAVARLERILESIYNLAAYEGNPVLNYSRSAVRLVPDQQSAQPGGNSMLWNEAAISFRPVSLCIGLPDQSSAVKGSFMNATTYATNNIEIVKRPTKPIKTKGADADQIRIEVAADTRPKPIARRNANYEKYTLRFFDMMENLIGESNEGADWIDYTETVDSTPSSDSLDELSMD